MIDGDWQGGNAQVSSAGSGRSTKTLVFWNRDRRASLSHHVPGRVRPESDITVVSSCCSLLMSLSGTIGCGPTVVDRNLMGSSVSLRFQRTVNDSALSHGRARPSRALSAVSSEASFRNWPLLSRWEADRA